MIRMLGTKCAHWKDNDGWAKVYFRSMIIMPLDYYRLSECKLTQKFIPSELPVVYIIRMFEQVTTLYPGGIQLQLKK